MKRFLVLAILLTGLILIRPVDQTHADEAEIPEGYILVDDMVLPESFLTDRAAIRVQLWPGTVPYQFDSNVSATNRERAEAAIAEVEATSGLDFVVRTNQTNFVTFRDSTGNNSPIGMQTGRQTINIVSWTFHYVIIHEIMHTLGFFHEQSRPDRDTYVNIRFDNIQTDRENNFQIMAASEAFPKGAYGLEGNETYDFGSVMHYDQCAFSNGCPLGTACTCEADEITIEVRSPFNTQWQEVIGQRSSLSKLDKLSLSLLYPETNWRIVDRTHNGGEDGALFTPFNTIDEGVNNTPNGGTVAIMPGTYNEVGVYDEPMTLTAPLGAVTIGD